jgi:O-antigen biosynthesis protein
MPNQSEIFNLKKILIIGSVWPEPNSTAAGSRMLQIINYLIRNNWEIVFASAAAKGEFSFDLNSLNIRSVDIQINDSDFDNFIRIENPHIVMFDRFMTEEKFGWRVSDSCPNAIRILDMEDLHCLRIGRQNAFKNGESFDLNDLNNDIAFREIASILRCDLSLVISEYELDLLKNYFRIKADMLCYLPFVKSNSDSHIPDFSDRKHFISIGNFLHPPNLDSVSYLRDSIWPLIHKALPEAEMHVYGAYPSSAVLALNNKKMNFFIKGRADNALNTISKYKLLLAPLRFGAGLKGKLFDALSTGTPSITTDIGAEGMHGNIHWAGTVANNAELFAENAVNLYRDENIWNLAQIQCDEILSSRFSEHEHFSNFHVHLNRISDELINHRKSNFYGAMISSQTLNSVKYMSRWIEEKNKSKLNE